MKLFFGILVALIILGGGFLILNKQMVGPQENTTQQNQQPIQSVQQPTLVPTSITETMAIVNITLTNQGFEPNSITLKQGTKVTFANKTSDAATVSSDPHPQHTLYPFLNLGRFEPEASLEVVFQNKGTFTYHNHLNPSQRGTVTVE